MRAAENRAAQRTRLLVCHLSQLEIFSSHPLVVEELQRQDVFEVAGLLNKEKNKTASSGYKNKQTTGSRGMLAATKRGW